MATLRVGDQVRVRVDHPSGSDLAAGDVVTIERIVRDGDSGNIYLMVSGAEGQLRGVMLAEITPTAGLTTAADDEFFSLISGDKDLVKLQTETAGAFRPSLVTIGHSQDGNPTLLFEGQLGDGFISEVVQATNARDGEPMAIFYLVTNERGGAALDPVSAHALADFIQENVPE